MIMNTSKKVLSINEMEQVAGGRHTCESVKAAYERTVHWTLTTGLPAADKVIKGTSNFCKDVAKTTSNLCNAFINWIKR